MAAADDILSVAQFKAQVFIPPSETSQDATLEIYRDAAIEYLEALTNRHLLDRQITLEVPIRYVPLSTSAFRLADLQSVTRLVSYPPATPYYTNDWHQWEGAYAGTPLVSGYGRIAGYSWPERGVMTYHPEARSLPTQEETELRFERVARQDLWRVWPDPQDAWEELSPYLPVHLDCQVGMPAAEVPSAFKAAAIIYMRFLWGQMPDFREGKTIDRLVGRFVFTNADQQAQQVVER